MPVRHIVLIKQNEEKSKILKGMLLCLKCANVYPFLQGKLYKVIYLHTALILK